MSPLYMLILVVGLIVPTQQEVVNVTLYYESLCPDSIKFIKQQLYPTWKNLSSDYLAVDFVPYGFSSQEQLSDGHWNFTCQHGPQECAGNKVQACMLSVLRDECALQVEFVHCFMSAENPPSAGPQCAQDLNITYTSIDECSRSQEGEDLLAELGDKTRSFKPALTWVPTVVLNNVFKASEQQQAMTDFLSVVCQHISGAKPSVCSYS